MAFIEEAFCKDSPLLIRIPFVAPTPVPTITAVGVASPNAHGQETTRTVTPNRKEKVKLD